MKNTWENEDLVIGGGWLKMFLCIHLGLSELKLCGWKNVWESRGEIGDIKWN